ncbi:MAG: mechanosensitive ion channel family protein [Methanomicrobiaceae archaeon]|nr:mechanosensitive ion channel family protein [Methanomicrobiaceae archaeon]
MNVTEFLETPIGTTDITFWNILFLVVVIAISVVIAKIATANIRRALKDDIPKSDLELILKIVYFGIIILGAIIALPSLDLSGVLLAGGIAGVVIGFASQSVVSNFISGLFLVVERPVRIGDNIAVGDIEGSVEDIRILSTVVKTYSGNYVRIPNERLFTSNITNYWRHVARRFTYTVGIRYEDDADHAIRIIKDVIWEHPYALKSPAPTVFVDNLGDNSVNISVYIWAPSRVWWSVRIELLWKIKKALEAEGIQIPFPQRTVWFPEGIRIGPGEEEREG